MANGISNHLLSLCFLIVDIKTLSNVGVCIADESRLFWEGLNVWNFLAPLLIISWIIFFWKKVRAET